MVDNKTFKSVEFDKILNKISKYTQSSIAKEKVLNANFESNFNIVRKIQDETKEAYRILFEFSKEISFSFEDVTLELKNASKDKILTISELLKIKRLLKLSIDIKKAFTKIENIDIKYLKEYVKLLHQNETLVKELDSAILSETQLHDNASPELNKIRKSIRSINNKIRKKLESYLKEYAKNEYLQDDIYTIRDGRYVLPVKNQNKSKIKGLVRDVSATGATVFVEPMDLVVLNNELTIELKREEEEIKHILFQFSQSCKAIEYECLLTQDMIANLDEIFSKAKYSREIDGVEPNLRKDGSFKIIKGRHPLIKKEDVVPVSVELESNKKILVITGANTGGKTVLLKMIGLFSIMVSYGVFVSAEEGTEISIYDSIFADIGDEQSIEQSLSTFSSHIKRIVEILNYKSKDKKLILLDELAMGTDPIEGGALAYSVSKHLLSENAISIITTHYAQLKEFALSNEYIKVASMSFDQTTYKPTYQLMQGIAGSSHALNIAKNLGVQDEIIKNARECLSDEYLDTEKLFKKIESIKEENLRANQEIKKEKSIVQAKLADIEKDMKTIARIKENLNKEYNKSIKSDLLNYQEQATDIIVQMKKLLKNPNDKNLFKARDLAKQIGKKAPIIKEDNKYQHKKAKGDIKVGDTVFVESLQNTAIITSVNADKKEYKARAGALTLNIKFKDCYKVKPVKKREKSENSVSISIKSEIKAFKPELNVIGYNALDAIDEIDKFFNQAYFNQIYNLSIIHGKGTGILRKKIQEYLRTNKYVDSYRIGQYREGESGVTIVKLKTKI